MASPVQVLLDDNTELRAINEQIDMEPPHSDWEQKMNCLGCKLIYFPEIDTYFLNEWILRPKYPLFVYSAMFCSLISMLLYSRSLSLSVTLFVAFTLWFSSYSLVVFHTPGYLPYYWSIDKRSSYTFEEQMDGVITNDQQYDFAFRKKRPERATLSKQARRFVMKGDHICTWAGNWIGFKNYRYFLSMLIWNTVYLCVWLWMAYVITTQSKRSFVFMWIESAFAVGFLGFILVLLFRHLRYLLKNTTTVQSLQGMENRYDLGWKRNIVQTLGPVKYCWLWFLPVSLPLSNDGITWEKRHDNSMI